MVSIGWFVSFLVFSGMELVSCCLAPLWFAARVAGAPITVLVGASMGAQLAGFMTVSFPTLILIWSAAFSFNRHMAGKRERMGGQN